MPKSLEDQPSSENFEPSEEWTEQERKKLILKISREMMQVANGERVDNERVFDWGERLSLIATQSATFLESNRKDILEGQGQWKKNN